ncbi:DUF481 domain-containing protein [Pedobacter sp. MW01-1-1]|uniref:DUF481 domain-containing protein n=1 Tax=Pedobacter sp. MW01-1-1 TaxID=3383027 RepID=UPI003FEEE323
MIVGEIKSLSNGVLTIETPYSKNDFTIKWSEIKKISSKSRFLLTLQDGRRVNGKIESTADSNQVMIKDDGAADISSAISDIVYIQVIKNQFWSRLKASVDIGFNITKANNLKQLTVRSSLGYIAERWQADANYNGIHSSQDSVASTKRTDAALNYKYFLPGDLYISSSLSFLSNTEQALKLRTTGKVGFGKLFTHTNKAYWGAAGGLSFNNENFSNNTSSRRSMEVYAGTELNLFDIGDLSLLTNWYVYRSLTESKRWRSDFQFDAKYEFLQDFYFKAGTTINYDNRPAVSGKDFDYVFQFTVGWEL